jgi:hypothetical protein
MTLPGLAEPFPIQWDGQRTRILEFTDSVRGSGTGSITWAGAAPLTHGLKRYE